MAKVYGHDAQDDQDGREPTRELTSQERLRKLKSKFEIAVDHDSESKSEAHRALRFYNNSELNGQWEVDDLAYLTDQGRPAFSFNICASKANAFLGFYEDAQRIPKVVPVGGEDELLAEALDIVCNQVMEKAGYERKRNGQLKTGTIGGECALHLEVEPDHRGRGWIKINLYRIMPFELHWDASSIEADRSDARCVFWDRWLTKDEYLEAYPDREDAYLSAAGSGDPEGAHSEWNSRHSEGATDTPGHDDYDEGNLGRYYYDRFEGKIRVIRAEYKEFVDSWEATDLRTGQTSEVEEEKLEQIQHAIAMGMPIELTKGRKEVVKVCEFIGPSILKEYDQAGPFEGFSIVTYCYAMDEESGTPYGFIRNLFDPQMELNKSKSLEIEHIAQSTAVGTVAEKGAITNEDQYVEEARMPGGVSIVEKNALVEGRVRDRQPSPPNTAVMMRAQNAVDLMNEISGIPSAANITPGEAAQAGITVAIRYNKARQSVSEPFGNFEAAQECLWQKVAETIARAMPDDQIEHILATDGRLTVQNGVIYELMQDPQTGQMVPKEAANLRDMRAMHHNIDLEHTTTNNTLRMIEFDLLDRLQQSGVPVDPELLVERAMASRSDQERSKRYVEETRAAQEQEAQQQAMLAERDSATREAQVNGLVQAETGKVAETQRHNIATEGLQASKQQMDAMTDFATLWEKADESEKDRLIQWAKIQEARRQPDQIGGGT